MTAIPRRGESRPVQVAGETGVVQDDHGLRPGVSAASRSAGSRLRSSARRRRRRPASRRCATAFAAATKLSDGSTTSSPGPQPTPRSARWSAAVPFATASACGAPATRRNGSRARHTRPHAPPSRRERLAPPRAARRRPGRPRAGRARHGVGHRRGSCRRGIAFHHSSLHSDVYDFSGRTGMGMRGVRAVILAGGRGRRLEPYTSVLPKPLMPVGRSCDRGDHRRPLVGARNLGHHALRRLPRPPHRGAVQRRPPERAYSRTSTRPSRSEPPGRSASSKGSTGRSSS